MKRANAGGVFFFYNVAINKNKDTIIKMMCANKVPDNWKMGSQKTFFLSILNKGISINILIVYYTEIE